jgi:hypothetical protein
MEVGAGRRIYAAVQSFVLAVLSLAGMPAKAEEGGAVHTEMRNVTYHFTESVSVKIVTLRGTLEPTSPGHWPIFDRPSSFDIQVESARILVLPSDLAGVLNNYVFSAKDAPLRDISLAVEKDRLRLKGKLHSKGDIPFETLASLSPNGDGRVRLHTEKVKALHLPVKGLMDLFGIEVDDLIKTGKVPGLEAEKDDLLLKLEAVLPAPRIRGPVSDIHIEGGYIVTVIGKDGKAASPATGNFMSFKGNQLQFGKLLMSDTDLTITDLDPSDPLDFFLERYKDQLVPGYSKITPNFGLRVFMKDFGKLLVKVKARSHG